MHSIGLDEADKDDYPRRKKMWKEPSFETFGMAIATSVLLMLYGSQFFELFFTAFPIETMDMQKLYSCLHSTDAWAIQKPVVCHRKIVNFDQWEDKAIMVSGRGRYAGNAAAN